MNRVLAVLVVAATSLCVACAAAVTEPKTTSDGAAGPAGGAGAGPSVLLDGSTAVAGWLSDPRSTGWLTADGYRLLARTAGQFVAVRAPLEATAEALQLSARFHKLGGPPGGGYGLIVDDQATSRGDGLDQGGAYVVAEVGDRGQIGVWRRDGTRWVDLVPWTASAAVHPGAATNALDVQTRGRRLVFVVNGQTVADLDAGLPPGRVGIFVGGDGNDVLLEHLSLLAAEVPQPAPLASRPSGPSTPTPLPAAQPTVAPANPPGETEAARMQRVTQLLRGIAEDVQAIFQSFAGGPNSPHNPVNDRAALNDAAGRLASATDKARDLAGELDQDPGPAQPQRQP